MSSNYQRPVTETPSAAHVRNSVVSALENAEYDDAGEPTDATIDAVLAAFNQPAKTYQATQAAAPGYQPAPIDPGSNQTFAQSQIAAMSPAEYQRNRAAIFAAQRAGRILNNQ